MMMRIVELVYPGMELGEEMKRRRRVRWEERCERGVRREDQRPIWEGS